MLVSKLLTTVLKLPITFINSSFVDTAGASVTTYQQTVPNGQIDDLLICIVGDNNGRTLSLPLPWIAFTAASRSRIFYKFASAASESSFTVTASLGTAMGGVVLRFRNSTAAPVIGTYTTATIAGPSTITATAVTATTGNYVLQIVVDGGSSKTFSQPSVSTGTLFTDSNTAQPSIAVFYQLDGSSDATTTKTGTASAVNFVQLKLSQ